MSEQAMSDRELLELAAKAVGNDATFWSYDPFGPLCQRLAEGTAWTPLSDDGDALRLAVKLRLDILHSGAEHESDVCVWVDHLHDFIEEPHDYDPYAATRRAIVRAAAAIGRTKP